MTTSTIAATAAKSGGPTDPPIPLVDLALQHARIRDEVTSAISSVMETNSFVLGPDVTTFEERYADFCGVRHCVGVANGTDAIELALRGAGIGPGDEVLIPANTFVATAEAVLRAGASLRLADCDSNYLLDPEQVASRITKKTRAVIGVDLYGQVADFPSLAEVVGPDIALLEDAAQSQGATRFGQPAGSFGVAAATSFYPGKNLGAYGDAGATLTNDDDVADRVRALRSHGGIRRYEHTYIGTNSRLDSIQAAVLRIKLSRLPDWNAERLAAAERYDELLSDLDAVTLPRTVHGNTHVWHLYVIAVPRRDEVLRSLAAAGIGAGIHYPAPIHRIPAFSGLGLDDGNFARAEGTAQRILSLPLYPGITQAQQERVAQTLRAALARP